MSVWQIVGLVFLLVLAGIAVLVLVGLWFWTLDRFRMVGRRRYFETNVIDTQIARVKNDPNATRQAIEELRLLQVVSTAPAPVSSDGGSVMRKLATFPTGAGVAQLGYRIFKWLLVLAAVMTACLVGYAWATYPTEADVAAAANGNETIAALTDAYTRLMADWVQQIKDLGQLFLLTPVFPLIGTVIGYIFGVRKNSGNSNGGQDGGPGGDGGDGVVAPDPGAVAPAGN
jgi:hypothetical protein